MSVWFVLVLVMCTLSAVLGACLLQRGVVVQRQVRAVDRRLSALVRVAAAERIKERGSLETLVRTLARISLLISKDLRSQSRMIREAGFLGHGAVNRILAVKVLLPLAGGLCGLAVCVIAGWPPILDALFTASLVVGGYFGPVVMLRWLRNGRRRRISRELPLFLDSVKLLVQTGASLELALRYIGRMDTTAIPEIRRTLPYFLEDLDQGKSYDVAFERWVEKLGTTDIEELAGLMLQSIKHGTELTPMLEHFIQNQIERRLATARELAGKRSVSLTVVMVSFFLPTLMVIIGAPAVVDIARTILR